MLFRGASSQWLKPVRVVGGSSADGPFFHGRSRLVCNLPADGRALFHRLNDALVRLIGQVRPHHVEVEHIFSKVFRNFVGGALPVIGDTVEHFMECLLAIQTHLFMILVQK